MMTFKTELQRCSQWIIFLESRVEKTSAEAEDYFGYQQLREDHIVCKLFVFKMFECSNYVLLDQPRISSYTQMC